MKNLPLYNPAYQSLYEAFYKAIIAKGYSKGKDSVYPSCAREFMYFLEKRHISDIKAVQAKDIIAYYDYLNERPNQRREGGLSGVTIRKHIYSLRLFFDYLVETKAIDSSPAALPKFQYGHYNERNILTVEEVKLLYQATENSLERALLAVAYGCGLRRSEIEKLNTGDVVFQKGVLNVREGKNNKNRTVPMSDSVIKYLREYAVNERPRRLELTYSYCEAFFINTRGSRMKGLTMLEILKAIIARTGKQSILSKNITLHCLRHSIATHLLDNDAGIEFVRKFLGHAMLDTTHLYSKRRKQQMLLRRTA